MIDTQLALEAQANITWIADHWDDLKARLGGSGGGGLQIRVQTSELPPLPIDMFVSDLMAEIDWRVARHYGQILLDDDPNWRPASMTTQGLLRGVAERYGHFVTDDRWAIAFCDDAHDYKNRVEKTLERPAPPEYLGPCPYAECEGELYAHGSSSTVRCPACLTDINREDQKAWVSERMADRLMTQTELLRGLKVAGFPVSDRTILRWVEKEKLTAPDWAAGMYSFGDALDLARSGVKYSRRVAESEGVG